MNTEMNSNTNTKTCDHKYECGCDKQYCAECVEIHIEEDMDDDDKKRSSRFCEDESCRHYYAHRNDNCDCDGWDCGFCNPVEEVEVHNICGCCRCDLTDDTGGNTMDDDEIWCDECYENETDECEECGELFRLGTFNTVDEADGTQFCFCDGCRDKMINNNIIVATDEETIYERKLLKCEQCDCEDKEKLAEYWWVEISGKKWTLCEDCGIAEEQEKC